MEKVYTYKGVAEILGVSDRTVWKLVNEDKSLKAIKVGKNVRITEKALNDFINMKQMN